MDRRDFFKAFGLGMAAVTVNGIPEPSQETLWLTPENEAKVTALLEQMFKYGTEGKLYYVGSAGANGGLIGYIKDNWGPLERS